MGYLVTRSFYEGNTFHEAGTPFEHQDKEYVEKCLADGNIVDSSDEGVQAQVAAAEKAAAIAAEDTAKHDAVHAPAPTEEPGVTNETLNPPAAPAPGQAPTAEQLAQDFQNAGVDTSSNAPQLQ